MYKGLKRKMAIAFICLISGAILSIQYRTNKTITATNIPLHRSQEVASEYAKLKAEREELLGEISSLEQKVKIYESGKSGEDELLETLYAEIEKYKALSGYKSLRGEGISIKLDDPGGEVLEGQGKSFVVRHYDTISEIINVLNAAQAEAIAINDQRYTSFTEIVPAGNHIEINGVSYGPPFVIKALGNAHDLENSLRIKGGVVWLMEQQYNIEVQINQEDRITVPKYTKIKEYSYSEPARE